MCTTSDTFDPIRIDTELVVSKEDVDLQTAFLVTLLVREGYTVEISNEGSSMSVTDFGREKGKDQAIYREAMFKVIAALKEDGEGVRSLIFTSITTNLLKKRGYIFDECACKSYNYPNYRRIIACRLPDNRIYLPSRMSKELVRAIYNSTEIKGNEVYILRLIEKDIDLIQ